MSEELKPCPFCGGAAELNRIERQVYCPECRISTAWYNTEEHAVQAWNTRANEPLNGVECYECQNGAPMVPYRTCHSLDADTHNFECSNCGDRWCGFQPNTFHYCPNCGAKVVEP